MFNIRISCQALRHAWVVAGVLLGVVSIANGQHQGDVWVGVDDGGRLAVSSNGFVPDTNYASLAPVDALIKGWSDDDPGFDRVVTPTDIDPMASGASIWLEVIEVDPAFQAIDDGFQFLRNPGDDTQLGGSNLHEHLTWHINNQDAAFDETQCVWHATFVLRDDGSTGYATSAPFTFAFTTADVRSAGTPANGDFDEDGLLNANDFAALAVCLEGGGPERVPQPNDESVTTCEVECLNAFDFDDDRDIDLMDVAVLQQLLP
jgi:hypothetical protein